MSLSILSCFMEADRMLNMGNNTTQNGVAAVWRWEGVWKRVNPAPRVHLKERTSFPGFPGESVKN